ncbi:MAG: glucose-1-phosphate thymidylyltransferase [Pelagibacteraceae bacterium]|nr:glucose-1-phosphate thymidylyltransferase [Pelagibacteraceae bacterium]
MKGIILSGGAGTRLHPSTISISKQLLPVFDKPLIYYPLCTLMSANIREILCITTPESQDNFKKLLGDGSKWGIDITFEIQKNPNGIAEAFKIGKNFVGNSPVGLILGDNIFYGSNLEEYLTIDPINFKGAEIFAYQVPDPQRYGVVEILDNKAVSIEEKPSKPKSSYVITGLYFYDNQVLDIVNQIKPSARNELEISDVNRVYLEKNMLNVKKLSQGTVWLDAGTTTSLLQASQFVQTIQERQQIQIGCPEELSWNKGWISDNAFYKFIEYAPKNNYGDYLKKIWKEKLI